MKKMLRGAKVYFACLFLLLWLVPFHSFSQVRKDTAFLHRAIEGEQYHAIFFDRKNSSYHKEIVEGFAIDTLFYQSVIQSLKDAGNRVNYIKTSIDSEWYSLHQYKKKHYAYLPSEPYVNLCLRITDSTVIMNSFNDGMIPAFIQSAAWIDNKTYQIQTKGLYKEYAAIVFHFLNEKRDKVVVEFPNAAKEQRFLLMTTEKALQNYPIIVNYSPRNRSHEWDFERPDFKSLLK